MSSLKRTGFMLTTLCVAMLSLAACGKKENAEKSNSITATTPITGEASTLTERNSLQRLQENLQKNFEKAGLKTKIAAVRPTEIPNMYWVTLENGSPVLASADAKLIFQGDVYQLGGDKLKNMTADLHAVDNKAKLASLDNKDLVIYPATTKTKHVIYVFTDVSCPYCHRLHGHMAEMNSLGIEVRYIAWPRGEQFYPTMHAIWCNPDRKATMEKGFRDEPIPPAPESCHSPVQAQYDLGMNMGVNGTPAIYSQDGHHIGAYMEPADLLKELDAMKK
ncbi:MULTISPECIES: DsbC family protein [unclassified Acinetobacter]|uniref:DsbC family protein n=1 Tax=unclassified Acinetobacter TaxID=196816 RepID=UPI0035B98561